MIDPTTAKIIDTLICRLAAEQGERHKDLQALHATLAWEIDGAKERDALKARCESLTAEVDFAVGQSRKAAVKAAEYAQQNAEAYAVIDAERAKTRRWYIIAACMCILQAVTLPFALARFRWVSSAPSWCVNGLCGPRGETNGR